MTYDEMDKATAGLPTKSAKIRVLDALGATRADIAKYLNIRYQHVRNVLVQPAPAGQAKMVTEPASLGDGSADLNAPPLTIEQAKVGLAAHFGVQPAAIEITIRG